MAPFGILRDLYEAAVCKMSEPFLMGIHFCVYVMVAGNIIVM